MNKWTVSWVSCHLQAWSYDFMIDVWIVSLNHFLSQTEFYISDIF